MIICPLSSINFLSQPGDLALEPPFTFFLPCSLPFSPSLALSPLPLSLLPHILKYPRNRPKQKGQRLIHSFCLQIIILIITFRKALTRASINQARQSVSPKPGRREPNQMLQQARHSFACAGAEAKLCGSIATWALITVKAIITPLGHLLKHHPARKLRYRQKTGSNDCGSYVTGSEGRNEKVPPVRLASLYHAPS